MDKLVALVDYVEELAYDDGYVDGCNHSGDYDEGYEDGYKKGCEHGRDDALREWAYDCKDKEDEDNYEDDYKLGYRDGYEDGCEDGYNDMLDVCDCNDNKPTLEDLFKEFIVTQMAKGR